MLGTLMSRLVVADAPPCVAFKHNPCHYSSAQSAGIYFVVAVIILICIIVLGLLTSRRRRRARRARRAGTRSEEPN
jgi:predicted permease